MLAYISHKMQSDEDSVTITITIPKGSEAGIYAEVSRLWSKHRREGLPKKQRYTKVSDLVKKAAILTKGAQLTANETTQKKLLAQAEQCLSDASDNESIISDTNLLLGDNANKRLSLKKQLQERTLIEAFKKTTLSNENWTTVSSDKKATSLTKQSKIIVKKPKFLTPNNLHEASSSQLAILTNENEAPVRSVDKPIYMPNEYSVKLTYNKKDYNVALTVRQPSTREAMHAAAIGTLRETYNIRATSGFEIIEIKVIHYDSDFDSRF